MIIIIYIKILYYYNRMLHTLDINNVNINNQPAIVQYWVTGKISPCIKEKNIKIIINEEKKKPK